MDAAALRRWLAAAAPGCAWTSFGRGCGMLHWRAAAPPVPDGAWTATGWRVVASAASRDGGQGVWMLRRVAAGRGTGAGGVHPRGGSMAAPG